VTGWWFSPGTLVSSTNKSHRHKDRLKKDIEKVKHFTTKTGNKDRLTKDIEEVKHFTTKTGNKGLWGFNATFNNISVISWR
jgi:hypothetical protein